MNFFNPGFLFRKKGHALSIEKAWAACVSAVETVSWQSLFVLSFALITIAMKLNVGEEIILGSDLIIKFK